MAIFKGDNTAAFGANFLTISVMNPDLVKISKIYLDFSLRQVYNSLIKRE
jgi:hypothetical protein